MKKYLVNTMVTVVALIFLLPIQAMATEDAGTPDGGGAAVSTSAAVVGITDAQEVSVTSSRLAEEKISSLQLELTLTAQDSAALEDAKLVFTEGEGTAKIRESRWHKGGDQATGRLRIYLADPGPLFQGADTPLKLGTVKALGGDGSEVKVDVTYVEGSLQYGTVSGVRNLDDPGSPVDLALETPETPIPDDPDNPVTEAPTDSPNKAKLVELLGKAKEYRAEDYTGESFGALRQAMEGAETILAAGSPTEEEFGEACMALENALAGLVKRTQELYLPENQEGIVRAATGNNTFGGDFGKAVLGALTGDNAPVILLAEVMAICAFVAVRIWVMNVRGSGRKKRRRK